MSHEIRGAAKITFEDGSINTWALAPEIPSITDEGKVLSGIMQLVVQGDIASIEPTEIRIKTLDSYYTHFIYICKKIVSVESRRLQSGRNYNVLRILRQIKLHIDGMGYLNKQIRNIWFTEKFTKHKTLVSYMELQWTGVYDLVVT